MSGPQPPFSVLEFVVAATIIIILFYSITMLVSYFIT